MLRLYHPEGLPDSGKARWLGDPAHRADLAGRPRQPGFAGHSVIHNSGVGKLLFGTKY